MLLFLSYLFANILINFSKKNDLVVVLYYTVYASGRGGVLSYFHVYVGSGHFLFLGFKILNFIFFFFWGGGGGSEKLIFLGVQRFCGYFWGVTTKLDYI